MEEKRPTEYFDYMMYTWNVDRARDLIKKRRCNKRPITVDVDEMFNAINWGGFMGVQINEEYALSKADVTKPLIFGLIKIAKKRGSDEPHGWFKILIDGHHRLYRAKQEGLSLLPAYELSKSENHKVMEGMFRAPPRRNPDEEMRYLERGAFSGDIEAKTRLLQSYLRTGKVPEQHIDLAAFYGDPAAQQISQNWFGDVGPESLRTYLTSLITQTMSHIDTEFLARRTWFGLDYAYQKAAQRMADPRWQAVAAGADVDLSFTQEVFERLRMYLDMLRGYLDEYNVESVAQENSDVVVTVRTMIDELAPSVEVIYLAPPVNHLLRAVLNYLRDFVTAAQGYAIDNTFQDPYWYALRGISSRRGLMVIAPEIETEAFHYVAPRIIPWLLSPKN